MSRRSEAKKARRKKRRAVRDARWVPTTRPLADFDDVGAAAEAFDARIMARGWTFDVDSAGDGLAVWFYEPSGADLDAQAAGEDIGEDLAGITRIWFTFTEEGDLGEEDFPNMVHAVLVGTDDDYQFTPDEIFEYLELLEAYRLGDATPEFD